MLTLFVNYILAIVYTYNDTDNVLNITSHDEDSLTVIIDGKKEEHDQLYQLNASIKKGSLITVEIYENKNHKNSDIFTIQNTGLFSQTENMNHDYFDGIKNFCLINNYSLECIKSNNVQEEETICDLYNLEQQRQRLRKLKDSNSSEEDQFHDLSDDDEKTRTSRNDVYMEGYEKGKEDAQKVKKT